MAVWSFSCVFISASTNKWIRALYPLQRKCWLMQIMRFRQLISKHFCAYEALSMSSIANSSHVCLRPNWAYVPCHCNYGKRENTCLYCKYSLGCSNLPPPYSPIQKTKWTVSSKLSFKKMHFPPAAKIRRGRKKFASPASPLQPSKEI